MSGKKYGIKLLIPVADGMNEVHLRCDNVSSKKLSDFLGGLIDFVHLRGCKGKLRNVAGIVKHMVLYCLSHMVCAQKWVVK